MVELLFIISVSFIAMAPWFWEDYKIRHCQDEDTAEINRVNKRIRISREYRYGDRLCDPLVYTGRYYAEVWNGKDWEICGVEFNTKEEAFKAAERYLNMFIKARMIIKQHNHG